MEPLSGYLKFADNLKRNSDLHGEAFNFGPSGDTNYDVEFLVKEIAKNWEDAKFHINSNEKQKNYEAGLLKLNCDKALHFLDWRPVLNFEETSSFTVNWYKNFYRSKDSLYKFTKTQILDYSKLAQKRNLTWADQF